MTKYIIKQKGARALKNKLITLMAVIDPGFEEPEAYSVLRDLFKNQNAKLAT